MSARYNAVLAELDHFAYVEGEGGGGEFTTSDVDGWGWKQAQRVSTICGPREVNLGNRCVPMRCNQDG